jgi:hypothetical protein
MSEALITATATADTAFASRYLQQLCKHWSHKFRVEFTPDRGEIELPLGLCRLAAADGRLTVTASAADAAGLERLQKVIAEHLQRFAFREQLAFNWSEGGAR